MTFPGKEKTKATALVAAWPGWRKRLMLTSCRAHVKRTTSGGAGQVEEWQRFSFFYFIGFLGICIALCTDDKHPEHRLGAICPTMFRQEKQQPVLLRMIQRRFLLGMAFA
jgi:hypothetical protein